jgi:hypothetical protein
MRTICAEAQLLADAARVLAARRVLEPVLERFAATPLDPGAVDELRSWLDDSYPPAAAALDRLRASAAAAPHPPAPLQSRLEPARRGRQGGSSPRLSTARSGRPAGRRSPPRAQRDGLHR